MTKPTIRIHNSETNEVIDREMTAVEVKEYEASQKTAQIMQADIETKLSAKTALLNKLGITAEEANLLLS